MWSNDEIKGKILHKLTRLGKFEHSHTAIEHLQKGFPKDMHSPQTQTPKPFRFHQYILRHYSKILYI